jgi:predicted nucleotidyltransferase
MSIKDQHIKRIIAVAWALGSLNKKVVYVGGAVVSLYANDTAARDVRPTDDVDLTLEITSMGRLETLRKELTNKGFKQSAEDDVMCRFRYEGLKVDVMATREIGWAPANPWFAPGFKDLKKVTLGDITIRTLSFSYFLATKISAFRGRAKDPRTSHDLEDVTYLLDSRTDPAEQIINAPQEVFDFLVDEFEQMLADNKIREAILGNLEYSIRGQRFERINEVMTEVIDAQQ